ncbi:hypothetical protein WJX84_011259 [Apatococcus fuscideae]|uniref:BSD domain-containing protein n=1 Tax=Apatococcus fuscideae TaxID=2026836 RepID=A0AAW1THF4_9CHLO
MLGLLSTLQGQPNPSGEDLAPRTGPSAKESQPTDSNMKADAEASTFSFWGVAAAISDTLKKSTADIASSVRDTDWGAELNAFRQGVTEESQQLKANTAAAVEQIPVRASQASNTFQLHLGGPEVQARLAKAGVNIEKFARKIAFSSGELFEDVKDAILSELGPKDGAALPKHARSGSQGSKYSRLEAEVAAMQRNSATYCEEPAPGPAHDAWLASFDLGSHADEIAAITQDNAFMSELQARIVPLIVSHDLFWTRYFYRLHLLQAENERRQRLTQRDATSQQEDPDVWQDDATAEAETSISAASEVQAGTETALHVGGAVAAGQQITSEPEGSPGHSRPASRAATEAESDEPETEDSGKSNGEGTTVSAPAHDPKSATAVKPEDSDADDLSDLSGSEAAGPMSEAEEDWGTWE